MDIELRCRKKADELLEKHFPDFIKEAAHIKPEILAEKYNNDLPAKVAAEFREWLRELWDEVRGERQESFDEIMNMQKSIEMTDASYEPYLDSAMEKAKRITLKEKLLKSNHEDVSYYKGILKQYTEELLNVMIKDFVGDIL